MLYNVTKLCVIAPSYIISQVPMSTNALFIAPLHLVTDGDIMHVLESKAQIPPAHVIDVNFSRNKNAVTVEFINEHVAGAARQYLSAKFPNVTVADGKTKKSATPPIEIPSPLASTDVSIHLPGLTIMPDWVSECEEHSIMDEIDAEVWDTTIKRRVQHYGFRFQYSRLDVDSTAEATCFPKHCQELLIRPELHGFEFNQLTINEYWPGIGIASHCDTHSAFTDCIAVVSLLADITMDFISHDSTRKVHVCIPRRSLMLMSGDSRYGWRHSIAARKSDRDTSGVLRERSRRVSLTFRNCTKKVCDCRFEALCDTKGADLVRPRRMQHG